MTVEIVSIEKQKLKLQGSPQQIAGYLKKHKMACVSHEIIYKYIWEDKRQGGLMHQDLRHHGKKYNKRSNKLTGRGWIIARIDIDQKPSIVKRIKILLNNRLKKVLDFKTLIEGFAKPANDIKRSFRSRAFLKKSVYLNSFSRPRLSLQAADQIFLKF